MVFCVRCGEREAHAVISLRPEDSNLHQRHYAHFLGLVATRRAMNDEAMTAADCETW
jgi:hypothetical protein